MAKKKKKSAINDTQRANRIILEAKNKNQGSYINAIKHHNQVLVLGPAGTGKTYIPAVLAAKAYLRGDISKIIITRPKIEVDNEDWGALPGTLHKKTAVWAYPVVEILEECMGKGRMIDAQRSGDIEVLPLAFMRGRTLQNAFCILDEAQNTSVNQMKMFVTRIGEHSKVIINGDIAQKDVRGESGLGWALDMMRKYSYLPAKLVEFGIDDVARSKACAMWIKAMKEDDCLLK